MRVCMQCAHWSPRDTTPEMARMGFAQCVKRMHGHMTAAQAPECDRFAALPEKDALSRRTWLARHGVPTEGRKG